MREIPLTQGRVALVDDEDRCELREGEDRCPNRATQAVREPYTPGRFTQRVCDDCAKSQIEFGYKPVPSIDAPDEAELKRAVEAAAHLDDVDRDEAMIAALMKALKLARGYVADRAAGGRMVRTALNAKEDMEIINEALALAGGVEQKQSGS